jgi:hypothetical protein
MVHNEGKTMFDLIGDGQIIGNRFHPDMAGKHATDRRYEVQRLARVRDGEH